MGSAMRPRTCAGRSGHRSRVGTGDNFPQLREHVIGVVLAGFLIDATLGLGAIKKHGGLTIVQGPADAYAPSMPDSALKNVNFDFRLPLKQIGPIVSKLVVAPARPIAPALPR